jgi:hypothetical protein
LFWFSFLGALIPCSPVRGFSRPWAVRLCGVPPKVGPPQLAHPIGLECALCRFARGAGQHFSFKQSNFIPIPPNILLLQHPKNQP